VCVASSHFHLRCFPAAFSQEMCDAANARVARCTGDCSQQVQFQGMFCTNFNISSGGGGGGGGGGGLGTSNCDPNAIIPGLFFIPNQSGYVLLEVLV
jgi:hypothetical protein